MKRLLIATSALIIGFWSAGLFAETIGVVDMQQIFRDSPQVKQINDSLKSEFSGQRAEVETMGKTLEADIKNYQKNKSVMSSSQLSALKNKINQEEMKLRTVQGKFQQDLFSAQNKKMQAFLDKVKSATQTVADKKGIDIVLPANAVVYSKDSMDITSDVLSDLK